VGVLAARPALLPIGVVADAAKRTSALVEGGARDFPLIPTRMVRDEVGALTTAFNRLLTRLSEALRRERAATERQRTFLADAAHELRTPVAIVLSAAEATLADQPDAEQGAESLRLIAGEARRMGGMVSDLLLLARSETGVTTEVRNRFFLEDAASSVVIRATRMPSAKNRSIRLGEFGTAPLNANRDLVERAIMALVDNALIHAPESPIEVSVGVASGRAWIRVRDWGPGVPPEDVDRIFERFSRGDTAASGSGLGLAIARWIAERHGGRLTYEAPSEGGASFLVTLPLAE
jgi:signal transduction histidine kinase